MSSFQLHHRTICNSSNAILMKCFAPMQRQPHFNDLTSAYAKLYIPLLASYHYVNHASPWIGDSGRSRHIYSCCSTVVLPILLLFHHQCIYFCNSCSALFLHSSCQNVTLVEGPSLLVCLSLWYCASLISARKPSWLDPAPSQAKVYHLPPDSSIENPLAPPRILSQTKELLRFGSSHSLSFVWIQSPLTSEYKGFCRPG